MVLTSFFYILFLMGGVICYYVLPGCCQWLVLLLLSILFYVSAAVPGTIIYVIITTITVYFGTLYISRKHSGSSVTLVLSGVLIVNAGLWVMTKGRSLWVMPVNAVFRYIEFPMGRIVLDEKVVSAMGMGYYTAQAAAYVLDCYWKISEPQKNPLKLLLFLLYFPQMTNGPISRYSQLQALYKKHKWDYRSLARGSQRILWGFMKKLVMADRLNMLISPIMSQPGNSNGIEVWIAVLLCPLQIYADFSGCMDIVIGTSELFGIELPENFNNPFFSRSMQEFWQRWHITLGTWSKDYVLYPCFKSKWLNQIRSRAGKRFGKKSGKLLSMLAGMGVTWLVIGIWHGRWRYVIGTSLYSYLFLMGGEICRPGFKKIRDQLPVYPGSRGWHVFQSVRTYLIFAVSTAFFFSFSAGTVMVRKMIMMPVSFVLDRKQFQAGGFLNMGFSYQDWGLCFLMGILMLVASLLREKYGYARNWVERQALPLRWVIWIGMLFVTMFYGIYGYGNGVSAFQYANF